MKGRVTECKAATLEQMYIQHCLFQYRKGLILSTKDKASLPSAHQITGTFPTSEMGRGLLVHTKEIHISVQTANCRWI
jgi:hypothetical protein